MSQAVTEAEKQEYQNRAIAISHMLRGDGWKLFETMLRQNEDAAYRAAVGAPDAFQAAKHLGALKVLKDLREWPARELTLIGAVLTPAGQ